MTFSVLARDPDAGWGLAIATARSAVGGRCAFFNEGGVVASQGMVSSALGAQVARSLREGIPASSALNEAIAGDPGRGSRQVLVVGADGSAAAWTGAEVPPWSGHSTGHGFAAGGNLLTGPEVLDALRALLADRSDDLLGRLLRAMEAAQAAGGDRRGQQSAAVLIGDERGWPIVNLRVDDHPNPVSELARLAELWRHEWRVYDETGTFPPANPPTGSRLRR